MNSPLLRTSADEDLRIVRNKLRWMGQHGAWPNGDRYLWTDACGVVLLVSLYHHLGDETHLEQARWVAAQVDRVLGLRKGIRTGERWDRDGQFFGHLTMWIYALHRLGQIDAKYHERAVNLVREIHSSFVRPRIGVYRKMKEDLSAAYPGTGFGTVEPYQGFVIYRLLAPRELTAEIAELRDLIGQAHQDQKADEDLALGMTLWLSHFFPGEQWALQVRCQALRTLDSMWVDPPGYFCRWPGLPHVKSDIGNYGIALGLQAVDDPSGRARAVSALFDAEGHTQADGIDAMTQVMACVARFPGEFLRES